MSLGTYTFEGPADRYAVSRAADGVLDISHDRAIMDLSRAETPLDISRKLGL